MAQEIVTQLKHDDGLGAIASSQPKRKTPFAKMWKNHKALYFMLIPAALLLLFLRIYPLWGIGIAFVDFKVVGGLAASKWVGLKHFVELFNRPDTFQIIRNTVVISSGKIILGETAGLLFALLINEVKFGPYKKFAQVVTTIPNFLSWVVVGALMLNILGTTGIVNDVLKSMGLARVKFLTSSVIFPYTMILSDTFKSMGWSALIYLAAMTQINPELIEAAAVDGAGRLQRIWHVVVPILLPTYIFMIALAFGYILDAGMDQILVLYNPAVYSTGDVLDTYVYRVGLVNFKYEIATVVGLVKAVVGFAMVLLANWVSGKLAKISMF